MSPGPKFLRAPSFAGIGALLLLAYLYLLPQNRFVVLTTSDVFLHLALGEHYLKSGSLPGLDPLSFTRAGSPYVAHEWLYQLIHASIYHGMGAYGLSLLTAMLAALIVYFSAVRAACWGAGPIAIAFSTSLSGYLAWDLISARPHLITSLGFAAGLLALERYEKKPHSPKLLAAWFGCFVIWMNLHPGLIGFAGALVLLTTAAFFLNRKLFWRRLPVAVAAIAALFSTPYGYKTVLGVLNVVFDPRIHGSLIEHSPHEPGSLRFFVFFGLLLFGLVGLWSMTYAKQKTEWIPHAAASAVFALMALNARRHAELYSIVALPFIAHGLTFLARRYFEVQYPAHWKARWRSLRLLPDLAWIFAGCGFCLISILPSPLVDLAKVRYTQEIPTAPALAVDFIQSRPELMRKRMFNFYNYGAYLAWRLPELKVFIDSRAEFYGPELLAEHAKIFTAKVDVASHLVRAWGIQWAILPTSSPAARHLSNSDWNQIYKDPFVAIFSAPQISQQ